MKSTDDLTERVALLEWEASQAAKREARLRKFIDYYSYVTRMGINQTYGVKHHWQDEMKELGFNIP